MLTDAERKLARHLCANPKGLTRDELLLFMDQFNWIQPRQGLVHKKAIAILVNRIRIKCGHNVIRTVKSDKINEPCTYCPTPELELYCV